VKAPVKTPVLVILLVKIVGNVRELGEETFQAAKKTIQLMRFAKGPEETCVAMTLGNRAISVMGLARFAELDKRVTFQGDGNAEYFGFGLSDSYYGYNCYWADKL